MEPLDNVQTLLCAKFCAHHSTYIISFTQFTASTLQAGSRGPYIGVCVCVCMCMYVLSKS